MEYSPIFAFLLALLITLTLIPILLKLAHHYVIVDVPGGRKTHAAPVPRLGGLAMVVAAFTSTFLWTNLNQAIKSVLIGWAILCFVGLIDDLISVRWWKKFLAQLIAATIVVVYGGAVIEYLGYWWGYHLFLPRWIAIPFSIIFIVGVTNAINLSDGLDGLAAGITLFIIVFLIFLAKINDVTQFYVPLAAILGAIWGFLRFNTHPAVIFMGDTGSYFLGFSVAVFTIFISQCPYAAASPLVILFILAPSIIDTLAVMLERIISGQSVFKPDQRHFHYRLVNLGFSPKEAVIIIYAIQALCLYLALILLFYPATTILFIFLAIITTFSLGVYWASRSGWRYKGVWRFDNSLRIVLGENVRLFLEKILLWISTILLSGFVLLSPFLIQSAQNGFSDIFIFSFPFIIAISYAFNNNIARVITRICIYYLLAFLTLDLLYNDLITGDYFGMNRWYLIYIVTLTVSTMAFIKLTSPDNFLVTPMDFLILLLAAAIPFIPSNIIEFSERFGTLMISIIFFSFAVEAIMSYGKIEERILITSSIISSVVIGIKYILGL